MCQPRVLQDASKKLAYIEHYSLAELSNFFLAYNTTEQSLTLVVGHVQLNCPLTGVKCNGLAQSCELLRHRDVVCYALKYFSHHKIPNHEIWRKKREFLFVQVSVVTWRILGYLHPAPFTAFHDVSQ